MGRFWSLVKPYFLVIFLQLGSAGMNVLAKSALSHGMSHYIFPVYRQLVATIVMAPFAFIIERGARPRITWSMLWKIVLLGFLEPVIGQNMYFIGMDLTTATFTAAMSNVLPAFTFVMACIFRLEKVNLLERRSQAKILGTIVTIGGAMIMTFITGPTLNLPWTKPNQHSVSNNSSDSSNHQSPILGSLMIATGCISWSGFMILQAITLRSYTAELSLTTMICFVGTMGDSVVALIKERGNPKAWALHFDSQLLTVVYSGIVCSALTYYIQGIVTQVKGPVFVTAFNPLCMVFVAIMSSLFLSEIMFLGRIIGAVVIIIGLYLVLWGKSKDQISEQSNKNDQSNMDKIAPENNDASTSERGLV